jgi:hypothetical protein
MNPLHTFVSVTKHLDGTRYPYHSSVYRWYTSSRYEYPALTKLLLTIEKRYAMGSTKHKRNMLQ